MDTQIDCQLNNKKKRNIKNGEKKNQSHSNQFIISMKVWNNTLKDFGPKS